MPSDDPPPSTPPLEPPTIELDDDSDEEVQPLDPKQMDRYECRSCGYTYEPVKGDQQGNIPSGVPFQDLPDKWRCPVCAASQRQFQSIGPVGKPSGFEENLGYGLGVNTLTPGQKNILIFSSLALAFFLFMSLYLLQ